MMSNESGPRILVELEVNDRSGLYRGRVMSIAVPACGLRLQSPGHAAMIGPRIAFISEPAGFELGHQRTVFPHLGRAERSPQPHLDTVMLDRHRVRELLQHAAAQRFEAVQRGNHTGWADLYRAAGVDVDEDQGVML